MKRAPVTTLLVVSWILIHVALLLASGQATQPGMPGWMWGAPSSAELLRWGALSEDRVADGEVERWITASFLHAFALHLLLNAWIGWGVGRRLETLIGSARTFLVFFASVLGGSAAHVLWSQGMAVGASDGVFGFVGALGVWAFAHGDAQARALRRSVLLFVVIGLGVSLLPGVALAAHAGGFVVGGITVLLLGPRRVDRPAGRPTRVLAFLCLGILLAAVVRRATADEAPFQGASARAFQKDLLATERLARRLYEEPRLARDDQRQELLGRLDALARTDGLDDWGGGEAFRAYLDAWRPVALGHVPDPLAFDRQLESAQQAWRPWRDRLRHAAQIP